MASTSTLLTVDELTTQYDTDGTSVRAVEDVSLELDAGTTVGLVGESGCGKTTTGLSMLRALPPQGEIVAGSVRYRGTDLVGLPKREVKKIQWKEIAMIYQGAMNAFNPVNTIGSQIAEALAKHDVVSGRQARRERIAELLEMVDLERSVANRYPHELSGGMKQRAAIAMAISCEPSVLIADEPTTGLDVILKSKMIKMLQELQDEFGFSIVFISHDISTVMNICDEIGVMYAGRLVEYADTVELYDDPRHPYTKLLLNSIIDPKAPPREIEQIPGNPPDLANPPKGCRFAPRCPLSTAECRESVPPNDPVSAERSHTAACFHHDQVDEL